MSLMLAILAATSADARPLDNLYRRAQREYHRGDFETALPSLRSYLEQSKTKRHERQRLLWVIDQIGRILLRERRDPDAAIAFFSPLAKDNRLNDAELDIIDGWVAAARDWKKSGLPPHGDSTAASLFEQGEKYYRAGLAITQFPGDDSGHAYFHIAASYLVPFVVHHDADPHLGEALYMMGDIRRRSWTDAAYWSHNHYLREAIRRFPHTPLAKKAYALLEQDVRHAYSGSGGERTPPSVSRMLEEFRSLSMPRQKNKRR